MRFNMALAGDLGKEIFDAIMPELQQEAKDASLAIFLALFPAEQQLCLA